MKRFILFCALSFTTPGVAQNDFVSDNRNSLKPSYGLFMPIKSQFQHPTQRSANRINKPIPFISLAFEHPRGYGRKNICADRTISYFFNRLEKNAEGVKTNWCAVNFSIVLKYDLFPQNKYFDLFVGGGYLFGSQLFTARKTRIDTYFNFNASLVPYLELRAQPFARLSIGTSVSFLYDVTRSKWLTFDARNYPPDYSKFTGTSLQFFVGWCFGN